MIKTRWAIPADKPNVAQLLRELMVYTASLYDKPESIIKSLETVLAELDNTFSEPENMRFVVAEYAGSVAGICCVETSYSTWHAKPYIVVNDVSVGHAYRRKGIGTALLQFVADHARSIGCCRVDLFVEDSNTSAQRLYEVFGFNRLKQASYSLPIQPSDGLP